MKISQRIRRLVMGVQEKPLHATHEVYTMQWTTKIPPIQDGSQRTMKNPNVERVVAEK